MATFSKKEGLVELVGSFCQNSDAHAHTVFYEEIEDFITKERMMTNLTDEVVNPFHKDASKWVALCVAFSDALNHKQFLPEFVKIRSEEPLYQQSIIQQYVSWLAEESSEEESESEDDSDSDE